MTFRFSVARTLAMVTILVACGAARADLLETIRTNGRIRVAIAGVVPPFNYFDANHQLAGSDVDTAGLLVRDLGVRLEPVRIANSERVTVLRDGKADLVISALSITPERERQIAFSVPYARISVLIASPRNLPLSSMLDLNGKRVGALAESSNLAHLKQKAPQALIRTYPENDVLANAYAAGEFEILSAPQSVIDEANRQVSERLLYPQFTQMELDVAIGIPKGEKPLREWVNAWVAMNLRSGRLNEIFRKHHGYDLPNGLRPSLPPR